MAWTLVFLLVSPQLVGCGLSSHSSAERIRLGARGEANRSTLPALFERGDEVEILFLGDSITQDGRYVEVIETHLVLTYPETRFRVINRGLSSETIAGTSEPDHDPPRPCLFDRLERDLGGLDPDLVVACYGMNDGIYHDPTPEVRRRYREALVRLVEEIGDRTDAVLVVVTPPPFDFQAFEGRSLPGSRAPYGYQNPFPGYDKVLAEFAEDVRSLPDGLDDDVSVTTIAIHKPLRQILKACRRDDPRYRIAPDGIHPDETGHRLMARLILNGLGVSADEQIVPLAGAPPTFDGEVPVVPSLLDAKLTAQLTSRDSPSPRLILQVPDDVPLDDSRYRLEIDERPIASFTPEEIREGIILNALDASPTTQRVREVRRIIAQLQRLRDAGWLFEAPYAQLRGKANLVRDRFGSDRNRIAIEVERLERRLVELNTPLNLRVRLRRDF